MRRLRVALVCHYLPPHEGGIERVVQRLAAEYRTLGLDVVTVGWHPSDADDGPSEVALRGWNGLERYGVPVPLIAPFSSRRRLARALDGVDAVHTHGLAYPACALALGLARRRGIPAIVTEHVGAIPYDARVLRVIQASVLRATGFAAGGAVRAVTVLNQRVGDEVEELVRGVPVVNVPNGVDATTFRPASPTERASLRRHFRLERPTVLAVGRNVPKKGFGRLLAAVTRPPAPGFDVLFVGKGTTALTAPGIRSIEALEQAELAELYRAVDLLVLPSEGEGLPLVVQEALASGLPVLMGDDPAVRRELPEGPVTFCDVAPDRLRVGIDRLLADTDRLARLGADARGEAIARYDWSMSARRYLELLGIEATGQ